MRPPGCCSVGDLGIHKVTLWNWGGGGWNCWGCGAWLAGAVAGTEPGCEGVPGCTSSAHAPY